MATTEPVRSWRLRFANVPILSYLLVRQGEAREYRRSRFYCRLFGHRWVIRPGRFTGQLFPLRCRRCGWEA